MAATTTLDVDRGTPLRISKASAKIAKKAMSAASRPAAKVYNTDPSSFRKLVQELTGLGIEPSAPPPPVQSERPAFNGRLQKIAPPPLSSDAVHQCSEAGLHPNGSRKLSPLPLVSPGLFSPITAFTPMEWMDTAASPASLAYKQLAQSLLDWEGKYEELQDPYLRSPEGISKYGTAVFRSSEPAVGPLFPLSPTNCPSFNLTSPGDFAGFEFGAL